MSSVFGNLNEINKIAQGNTFDNQQNEVLSTQDGVEKTEVKKSRTQKISLVESSPSRILPKLVEELIEKGIPVLLRKDGYAIGGFYGINDNGYANIAEIDFNQSNIDKTQHADSLIAYDVKNKPHLISSFDDLIKFHLLVWKSYLKQKEYCLLNSIWYPYIIQSPYISITPNI